jgi:hypothetical protein
VEVAAAAAEYQLITLEVAAAVVILAHRVLEALQFRV